jgi:hypothetical protein
MDQLVSPTEYVDTADIVMGDARENYIGINELTYKPQGDYEY